MTPSTPRNRIHQLPPEIASRIAAGEVVERPANAVKELVENAIDAGARRITVEIEDGGKKLIRVRDDGCGMGAGDAMLALQRHATSKLRDVDDLHSIRTLGFRGEALPSIAAVSRLELTTRENESESGTRIRVEGGIVESAEEVGCAPGTDIAVRGLFYNTPARFKFLKSDAAEAARISEMMGHLALAYPHIAFRLSHNGNENLATDGSGDAFNALVGVLGRETARQMLPITPSAEASEHQIRVEGFAGRPQLTRANRNGQIFFVNGRAIKNSTISHAFAAAYEGLMHGHRRHPVGVLFIHLPPNAVDVNVHPTKSEVRFARDGEIHHAARVAVRDTLVASQLAPEWGNSSAEFGARSAEWNNRSTQPSPMVSSAFSRPIAPRGGNVEKFREAYRSGLGNNNSAFAVEDEAAPEHGLPQPPAPNAPRWNDQSTLPDIAPPEPEGKVRLRPLAQIQNNAYILCEAEDGLYIVCQHRAHERILADKALAAAEGKAVESQRLAIPFTVEAGPRAAAALEENAALVKDLGFEVEAFGGASVLVRAVPALVAHKDYETAFADLVDELVSGRGGQDLQDRRRALLTMLACKNAIKAGDPLNDGQIKGLLDDLMELPSPGICPHGQPILIKISTWELNKKFEREYASR